VVKVSSTLVDSRLHRFRPHGFPSYDVGLAALPRVANAIATWRQAKVCLQPLFYYG
jgi:hypothetical protein